MAHFALYFPRKESVCGGHGASLTGFWVESPKNACQAPEAYPGLPTPAMVLHHHNTQHLLLGSSGRARM
jgi:hypothetical protein